MTWEEQRQTIRKFGLFNLFKARRAILEIEGATKAESWTRGAMEMLRIGGIDLKPGPTANREDFLDDDESQSEQQPAATVDDLEWVYHNIELADTKIRDAPGSGTWGLLLWARANKNDFFKLYLARKSKLDANNPSSFNDDGRRHFEQLNRVLRDNGLPEFVSGSQDAA